MYDETGSNDTVETHLEILEEIINPRINIQRIQPKRENPRFPFSLCIKVFNHGTFILFEGFKTRPSVEQVGDKGEVEFGVSGDEGRWGEVLATTDRVGVGKDLDGGKR